MNIGDFYTEHSAFTVTRTGLKAPDGTDAVEIKNAKTGETTGYTVDYIEKNCQSSSAFDTTKKVSRTELNEVILANPRTAMSVSFHKLYTAKDAAKEVAEHLAKGGANTQAALAKVITMKGQDRVMVGQHFGDIDEHGRLRFFDAEANGMMKAVDFRTTYALIVNNTKYIVK